MTQTRNLNKDMSKVIDVFFIASCLFLMMSCDGSGQTPAGNVELEDGDSEMSSRIKQEKQSYTNSIGMEFIRILAGTFLMGSKEDDPGAYDIEKPQHEVRISEDFYLGKYEVTQEQWEKVMGHNPYERDRSNPYYNLPGMKDRITRSEHPATVSWEDAQEFIEKLNDIEGHIRYRLPTEAEWEYAARAGTTTAYSFGNDENDLESYAWYGEDFQSGGTHPVGQKRPNPWGLYDIHGNAWEWVQDRFDPDYYAKSPAVDPSGSQEGTEHAVRGGSWHNTATSWR